MRRVLVIDDHEPSRRNLLRALPGSGFEVAGEGASGAGALELSLATNPEVILMAVGLADLDGIRAARRIMQGHPLPIILLTSHFDAVTIERAKRAGIMGYLVNPLRGSELAPAIELAVAHFEEFIALRKENDNLKKTLEARKIIERANTASSKRTSKRCSFKRRAKARSSFDSKAAIPSSSAEVAKRRRH